MHPQSRQFGYRSRVDAAPLMSSGPPALSDVSAQVGLSASRNRSSHDIIVKQHGGTIDVETEPGLFIEFKIVLPRRNQR